MFNKYLRIAPTIMVAFFDETDALTSVPDRRNEYIATLSGQACHCYDPHNLVASGATKEQLAVIQEGEYYLLGLKEAIERNHEPVVEPTEEPTEEPPVEPDHDIEPAN